MILSQKLLRDFKLPDFRFAQFMETVCPVVRLFDTLPALLSPVRLREVTWIDKSLPAGHSVVHDVVDLTQLPLLRLIIRMSKGFPVKMLLIAKLFEYESE